MRKIRSEIRGCMTSGKPEKGHWEASFCFPTEFIAFQGHFPGRAILPGACQIQCLLTMLEEFSGKSLALKEIMLAKYIVPVEPGKTVTVRVSEPPDPGLPEATVKGIILRDEVRVSEIRVHVSFQEKADR